MDYNKWCKMSHIIKKKIKDISQIENLIYDCKTNEHFDKIPNTVKEFKFKEFMDFNDSIDNLPDHIETLWINFISNNNTPIDKYPSSLKKIYYGVCFKGFIKNLSDSITHIYLLCDMTNPITFPSNLKFLRFRHEYNYPLDNLPNSLEILHMPTYFKYKIYKFPKSLKEIEFSTDYNYLIDNLPDSVEIIKLGYFFDREINKFPVLLKKIYFDDKFNEDINNLPDSVEELTIISQYDKEIKKFPNSLKILTINKSFKSSLNNLSPDVKINILNFHADIYWNENNETNKINEK